MSEWRPIATAPRDGSLVLTYSPQAKIRGYPSRTIHTNYTVAGVWQSTNERFWPPTHWMPLPEPPKDSDAVSPVADVVQWFPISTAPTDGTLVRVFAHLVDPARWDECVHDLPAFECDCAWHPDAGWCVDEIREVTHWRPKNSA